MKAYHISISDPGHAFAQITKCNVSDPIFLFLKKMKFPYHLSKFKGFTSALNVMQNAIKFKIIFYSFSKALEHFLFDKF